MSLIKVVTGDPFGPVGTVIHDAGVKDRVLEGFGHSVNNNGDVKVGIGPGGRRGFNFNHPLTRMEIPFRSAVQDHAEFWFHFNFAPQAWDTTWSGDNICGLYCRNEVLSCELHIDPTTRHLQLRRRESLIAENTGQTFDLGVFYHISWRVLIGDGTAGASEVWVDGVQRINASSIDTLQSSLNPIQADSLRINGYGSAFLEEDRGGFFNVNYADIIINDTLGAAPFNGRLDQKAVAIAWPEADTADEDFTLSAGGDSFALVGKAQDADQPTWPTDYIRSTGTPGDKTIFALPAMADIGLSTVDGVVPFAIGERDEAGGGLEIQSRIGASEVDETMPVAPSDALPFYQQQILETKPGGGAWDESGFNSLEVGVKAT